MDKISPDTWTILGGLAVAGLTWLYHKVKGDQADSFEDTLRGLGKAVIHTLLMDPAITAAISVDALRTQANVLLWKEASAIGVPRNTVTEQIATTLIQHIVGDVLTELRAAASLQDQVDQLNAQVAAMPAVIAKTEADALAKGKAWAAENVEVIPPDTKPDASST